MKRRYVRRLPKMAGSYRGRVCLTQSAWGHVKQQKECEERGSVISSRCFFWSKSRMVLPERQMHYLEAISGLGQGWTWGCMQKYACRRNNFIVICLLLQNALMECGEVFQSCKSQLFFFFFLRTRKILGGKGEKTTVASLSVDKGNKNWNWRLNHEISMHCAISFVSFFRPKVNWDVSPEIQWKEKNVVAYNGNLNGRE